MGWDDDQALEVIKPLTRMQYTDSPHGHLGVEVGLPDAGSLGDGVWGEGRVLSGLEARGWTRYLDPFEP